MPGIVVRADDAHRALEERRLEELTQERDHWALSHRLVCAELAEYEAALAALVQAWGLPERDWYRDDYDALIERARALLGGTGE